jgi:hypothetical protein
MITGVVQDSVGQPIPYAVVIEKFARVGVIGDASGSFKIGIPDSLKNSAVTVSCLGYETSIIAISDFDESVVNHIVLKEKINLMNPVTVLSTRARFCPEVRGINAKRSGGQWFLQSGYELALLIPTTVADSGIIRAVRYFIAKDGIPTSPFRVVLYGVDPQTKAPGKILLDRDTIVQASRGNHWFEVDISSFNISVPTDGFYVAMQWLPGAEAYTKVSGDHTFNGNGQAVGLKRVEGMKSYVKTLTGTWTNFNQPLHPMFAAVLSKECR